MANNLKWSADDLKKKGLIMVDGVYVKASSQVNTGKVDKLPNLLERAIPLVRAETDAKLKMAIIIDKSGPAFNNKLLQGRINEINAQEAFDGKNTNKFLLDEMGMWEAPKASLLDRCIGNMESGYPLFKLPDGNYIEPKYIFDLEPMGAPRMTQSDKWKTDPNHPDPLKRQREPVRQYYETKDKLHHLCEINGYKLTETLNILFILPFPKTYSKKKREQLNNQPHDQKPDIDNMEKFWMDALSKNDCRVWNVHGIKLWGEKGQIIIF